MGGIRGIEVGCWCLVMMLVGEEWEEELFRSRVGYGKRIEEEED